MSTSVAAAGCSPDLFQAKSVDCRKPVRSLFSAPAPRVRPVFASGLHASQCREKKASQKVVRLTAQRSGGLGASCHGAFVGAQQNDARREAFHKSRGRKFDPLRQRLLSSLSSVHSTSSSLIPLPSLINSSPAASTHKPHPILVARRDGRRSGWRRNREKRSGSSFTFAAIAIASVATLALTGAVGAIAAAITVPTLALGIAGFAVLSSLTAVLAIVGPLLLFFIPFFGFPLALFLGASGFAFGGLGGAVRTALDVILTLTITGNFVSALIGRARKRRAEEDPEEEDELPIGEQIRRVAMAQVEKSLKDMRATIPKPPEKEKKSVKKESTEELAVRRANEAQEALSEVASTDWFGPTVLTLVPGLNGLAWFAAADAFPTAVQGPRRSTFVRNALVYGAPALLYLLAAPFQGVSIMGFMRGEAWWLSLVFGLVHLQLERKDMVDEARVRVAQTALPEPKPEDELERVSRELKEFDSQLSSLAWWNEPPSKWTEANVASWLRDEGLERLVGNFAEHHIDGGVLLDLKGQELRDELGITSLGDRKRVLAAIARLREKQLERDARVVKEFDT